MTCRPRVSPRPRGSITRPSTRASAAASTASCAGYSRVIPLLGMAQAGNAGYFDEAGFPAGHGWEEIPFPEVADEHAYALEITGESMMPVYRDGDRIVVSPGANVRRGDRVVVKTYNGEVMAKQLSRQTAQKIELKSFNAAFEAREFALADIVFMHRIIWAAQ